MEKKRNRLFTVFFLISGAALLLIAEFSPWVSKIYSPWYFFESNGFNLNSLIYTFPIISSIITLILGVLMVFFKNINKIYVSIILFVSLSFSILFLFEMFSISGISLYNSIGVFLGFGGLGMIFWGLFYMLSVESQESKKEFSNESILNDLGKQEKLQN